MFTSVSCLTEWFMKLLTVSLALMILMRTRVFLPQSSAIDNYFAIGHPPGVNFLSLLISFLYFSQGEIACDPCVINIISIL